MYNYISIHHKQRLILILTYWTFHLNSTDSETTIHISLLPNVELETGIRPLPMIAKIQKERLKAGRMVFLCLKCKVHCGY